MPSCNELDKGSKFAFGENRADFHQVLFYKNEVVRFLFGNANEIRLMADCAPETDSL
jgi:hypothetical protein